MKRLKYLLAVIATGTLLGCEEPASVEIDSLSAMGDEFFFGQKVKVWMAVNSNDLPAARYTWSSQGGRLTQPQGLDENTWEAPREAGTYTITCEVDVNGTKRTRSREMWVSSYYFEKFEKSTHTFTLNSSAATLRNGALETRVNSTTAARGYIQRAFADPALKAPVSSEARVGWLSNFPADAITVGASRAENTLYYEWTLNRDPERRDNLFIDNLRFEWYPVGRTSGLPLDPDGEPYNGWLRIQQRNATTSATSAIMVRVNHPALSFARNESKKVSLTVDADYLVHVYVEGTEILKSTALQEWRQNNNATDDIYVNQWRINYCSNSSGQTAPTLVFDDAYVATDGSILK